jgi:poly-gamma-glutamate synthesis protein (capsule biosynthesis protein)
MSEAQRSSFPYAYTPERHVPLHQRVRAEGRPPGETAWRGISYLRKWADPKKTAPPEEVRHFDEQRALLRSLRAQPAPACSLALVGDIMWLRGGWHDFLSPEVLAHLNAHDVVLGNLESVISPRFKVPTFLPDYLTYNSDPALVTSFRRPDGRSTFTALSTANNHSLDRGDVGMLDTLALLDRLGILHSGVRASEGQRPFVTFEAGGIKFGFYAACWGFNTPRLGDVTDLAIEVLPGLAPRLTRPDLARVRSVLADMTAEGVDFKVVALHWGHEFEFYPLPEQVQLAHEVVRAGADLLMGTHPHVVQPLEVCYVDGPGGPRKGLIAYSLGNFATAMFGLHCHVGLVLSLTLSRDPQTGRVGWYGPGLRLVYNEQRARTLGRPRLMFLDDYLRSAGGRKLRELEGFLWKHLLGE